MANRDQFMVTRRSLVDRLANWNDQKNWRDFFDTYWKLIYGVARKAGLTEAEAQDVVQETVITVAKKIDGLKYDPAIGSFKGWLLNITRWRVADQFRKRQPSENRKPNRPPSDTATVERVPDPAGIDLESVWEQEWQEHLLEAALARVRKRIDPKQYQIFDCYVVKGWAASRVAAELRVHIGQVYLARHRVSALVRKEIEKIERPEGK